MVVLLFEQQHAHAEDRAGTEFFPQAVGHRAEVFTEDDGLVSRGLQGQQAQQVVHRVVEVGAVARWRTKGNHPESLQTHHMVDAQAAGVGEVGPQHFDKGAEAMALQAFRGEGGDAPALPGAVEDIGRRADGEFGQQFVLPAPGLAAATIGTDGEVGDQADAHAAAPGRVLRAFQATGDQPLTEGVETDFLRLFLGEAGECRAAWMAPFLGPMAPVAAFVASDSPGLQRFETAVVFQGFAAGQAEAVEILAEGMVAQPETIVQGA